VNLPFHPDDPTLAAFLDERGRWLFLLF